MFNNGRIEVLERELHRTKNWVQNESETLEQLQKDVRELVEVVSYNADLSRENANDINDNFREADEEIESINSELNRVSISSSKANMRIDMLYKIVDSMKSQLDSKDEQIEALTKQLEAHEEKIELIIEKHDELCDELVEAWETTVDEINEEFEVVKIKIDEVNERLDSYGEIGDNVNLRFSEDLNRLGESVKEDVVRIDKALKTLKSEDDWIHTRVTTSFEDIRDLGNRVSDIQKENERTFENLYEKSYHLKEQIEEVYYTSIGRQIATGEVEPVEYEEEWIDDIWVDDEEVKVKIPNLFEFSVGHSDIRYIAINIGNGEYRIMWKSTHDGELREWVQATANVEEALENGYYKIIEVGGH